MQEEGSIPIEDETTEGADDRRRTILAAYSHTLLPRRQDLPLW